MIRLLKYCFILITLTLNASVFSLSITTWNLEHLVDMKLFADWRTECKKDPETIREDIPYCNALSGKGFPCPHPEGLNLHTETNYQKKLDLIKDKLNQLDSDIYAFQEVSGSNALKLILDENKYKFYQSHSDLSQELAFAVKNDVSKHIIGKHIQHDIFSIKKGKGRKTRPALELNIRDNGKIISLLNVHLKSSCAWFELDNAPIPKETNECKLLKDDYNTQLKKYIDARKEGCSVLRKQIPLIEDWIEDKNKSKDTNYIVLGDFNRNFEMDRQFKARLDASNKTEDNTCDGYKCKGKIGSFSKEISDNKPKGASVWTTPGEFRKHRVHCEHKEGKKYKCDYVKNKFRCHPYDYFLIKKSFWDEQRSLQGDDYSASISGFENIPSYNISTVKPSDHCPISLILM